MEIGANAFNILTVWRDRRHEEELQAAETEALRAEMDQKPGVILNVAKQRNGDFEGLLAVGRVMQNADTVDEIETLSSKGKSKDVSLQSSKIAVGKIACCHLCGSAQVDANDAGPPTSGNLGEAAHTTADI